MEARDILIRPWITEKSTALMEEGKYTFKVAKRANKVEIGTANTENKTVLAKQYWNFLYCNTYAKFSNPQPL